MTDQQPTREATAYLQLVPGRPGPYGRDGWDKIHAVVARCTSGKPDTPLPGAIVVKIRVRVPAEAWEPLQPEAVIDIPPELVARRGVVEVVAEDAR